MRPTTWSEANSLSNTRILATRKVRVNPPQPLLFASECEVCPHAAEMYCPAVKGKCKHTV